MTHHSQVVELAESVLYTAQCAAKTYGCHLRRFIRLSRS
jgi:hypothetical protein